MQAASCIAWLLFLGRYQNLSFYSSYLFAICFNIHPHKQHSLRKSYILNGHNFMTMGWNNERILLLDPDILLENHLPKEINARVAQIKEIEVCLRPITEGGKPVNCWPTLTFIFGCDIDSYKDYTVREYSANTISSGENDHGTFLGFFEVLGNNPTIVPSSTSG